MAFWATSVIWAPSNGSSTMASILSLISVSTCEICWLTSLVPSTMFGFDVGQRGRRSSLALSVIAAIQPWSAAGAEKPILTILPSGFWTNW